MTEIEFLPDWYTKARRRRKHIALQAWVTAAVAVVLGGWLLFSGRGVRTAEAALSETQTELTESRDRVRHLSELEIFRTQLGMRDRIDRQLGADVGAARVLALIERTLPVDVAVTELECDTRERSGSQTDRSRDGKQDAVDRTLQVQLKGVSPSNVEVANFMEAVQQSNLCQAVRLEYARDRVDGDRVICEFSLEFVIDLSFGE